MGDENKGNPNIQEILVTLICSMEVIAQTMIDKGLMTREEYWEKINHMKAKRNVVE